MSNVDVLALWFLFIFVIFVPWVAIKNSRRMREGALVPPRNRIFVNVLVMQAIFLGIALFAAYERGIDVLRPGTITPPAVALAAAMLVLSVATLPLRWRLTAEPQRARLLLTRPARAGDLPLWGAVSLAAGIVEETVYRGVMMALVLPMTGNWWAAVAICIAAFTAGHVQQGWQRMIFIALVAFVCHALVALTGALYVAMAVHAIYDFAAGVFHVRLAMEAEQAVASGR
jgi:membrane protease YdiL (CAAX protease family)